MAIRGIKTKIAFNVAILVLLSAIITDVLVVVVVQSILVRQEVDQSRKILKAIGHYILDRDTDGQQTPSSAELNTAGQLASATHLTTVQVTDQPGHTRYQQKNALYPVKMLTGATQYTLDREEQTVQNVSMQWSGFWWHPQAVIISIPIQMKAQFRGAATGMCSLSPIYQQVSRFNKPILFYIVINTLILTIIGLYRIFRLYLRPIDRIIRQADDYHEDGDLFFAFRQEDNQLNRLSSALNRMLNRIKADKETLKTTVVSLERANAALKNAQKKIVQTEKMASVGRLASGIAHEIGNPIGIVLGYLEMLKKNDLPHIDEKDFIHRAEEEVQRINTVIRQLLDLARPKDPEFRMVDLKVLIEDIMAVMRMQPIMSHIHFEAQCDPNDNFVRTNADQLRQVFLNLLLNAADAIQSSEQSKQGRITIQTVCLEKPDSAHAPHIQIRFEDNGIGMHPEILDNIFDPFYTTKEPGKGTGLGLAVSYMIVEGIGGSIFAESQVGVGSRFTVELPLGQHKEAAT